MRNTNCLLPCLILFAVTACFIDATQESESERTIKPTLERFPSGSNLDLG